MALEFQHEIRRNAQEMQSYLRELDEWKREVSEKERKANISLEHPIRSTQPQLSSENKSPNRKAMDNSELTDKADLSHEHRHEKRDSLISDKQNREARQLLGDSTDHFKGAFALCKLKKTEANDAFKAKEYAKAVAGYNDVLTSIEQNRLLEQQPDNPELKAFHLSIYSNLAQCAFIRRDYSQAIKLSKTVLSLDPQHLKSCYRLAKAFKSVKDYKGCDYYLTKGLNLCKDDEEAKAFKDEINQLDAIKRQALRDFKNSLILPNAVSPKPKININKNKEEEAMPFSGEEQQEDAHEPNEQKGFADFFKERAQSAEPSHDFLRLRNIDTVAQRYTGLPYAEPGDKPSSKVAFRSEHTKRRKTEDQNYESLE